jgi:hypothetical protein
MDSLDGNIDKPRHKIVQQALSRPIECHDAAYEAKTNEHEFTKVAQLCLVYLHCALNFQGQGAA